ncbi:MAG TPA: hypothetical protein VKV15_27975 [Bryobacteraceae bacterium]|nr:hypothetical protein [Bryobacteraceae bacterium]
MNNGSDQEYIRRHERTEKILEAVAAKQEKTEDELRAFIKSQVLMGENMDKMTARNDRADSRMDRMEAIIEKIDLRLAEATEKLDALIDIVDRHVRDDKRHN